MTQQRLNHLMILSVHKEKTDLLDINQLGNAFVQGSDHRHQQLGTSKKWLEILRSHSSFHKTHTSNDMYQKFQSKSAIILMTTRLIGVLC